MNTNGFIPVLNTFHKDVSVCSACAAMMSIAPNDSTNPYNLTVQFIAQPFHFIWKFTKRFCWSSFNSRQIYNFKIVFHPNERTEKETRKRKMRREWRYYVQINCSINKLPSLPFTKLFLLRHFPHRKYKINVAFKLKQTNNSRSSSQSTPSNFITLNWKIISIIIRLGILFYISFWCTFTIFFSAARIYRKPTWWNRSNWVGIIITIKWEPPLLATGGKVREDGRRDNGPGAQMVVCARYKAFNISKFPTIAINTRNNWRRANILRLAFQLYVLCI